MSDNPPVNDIYQMDEVAEEQLEQLRAEVARLKQRTEFTYCAFCGEEFTLDPTAVVDHIKACKDHPLSAVVRENKRLTTRLDALDVVRRNLIGQVGRLEAREREARELLHPYREEDACWCGVGGRI